MIDIIPQAVAEARAAAVKASREYVEKHGEPFYCGFAWVEIKVERTNSKEAKALIAAGFSKDYQPKTLSMWNPGGHPTQSMDVKEAGAYAMAEVLRQYGLKAYARSRAD
jgi:galactose-1-phosphate uridylyltransferase